MIVKILSVRGVRSYRPVVLAAIDGYFVKWNVRDGWSCDCIIEPDELTCPHVTIMADMLDDKVLGEPA